MVWNMNDKTKAIMDERAFSRISINRIPQPTFFNFKEIAKEHCDDYGLTLKTLVDSFKEQRVINKILIEKLGEKDE